MELSTVSMNAAAYLSKRSSSSSSTESAKKHIKKCTHRHKHSQQHRSPNGLIPWLANLSIQSHAKKRKFKLPYSEESPVFYDCELKPPSTVSSSRPPLPECARKLSSCSNDHKNIRRTHIQNIIMYFSNKLRTRHNLPPIDPKCCTHSTVPLQLKS